jgi:predicted GNAT family acetyltransferase
MSIPSPAGQNAADDERTVELVEAEHRYVLLLNGERVGFTTYADHGAQRVFVHTEIDPGHSGKGLASTLVAGALADVRARNLRVVAISVHRVLSARPPRVRRPGRPRDATTEGRPARREPDLRGASASAGQGAGVLCAAKNRPIQGDA